MRRQGDQDAAWGDGMSLHSKLAARGCGGARLADPTELRDLELLSFLSAIAPLGVLTPGVAAVPAVVAGLLTVAAAVLGLLAWDAHRGHGIGNGLVAWPVVSNPPRRAL
jgi:hypothetical protein